MQGPVDIIQPTKIDKAKSFKRTFKCIIIAKLLYTQCNLGYCITWQVLLWEHFKERACKGQIS